MIKILKGNDNNCVFTLNEKTTIDPVFYILEIYSNQDHNTKLMLLQNDISSNKNRWNQFVITENDIEDINNSIITLKSGSYDYFVWQSSVSTLDVSLADSIIESGKIVVIGDSVDSIDFTNTETEFTFGE